MENVQNLSHTKWECKYHVVWIPKCFRRVLFGQLRRHLGEVLHMLISIPPKYAISHIIGYLKGKRAIHITRTYLGQRRNYNGMNFWARGYFVSTVGANEEVIRAYIRAQEQEDAGLEQLALFK